MATETDKKNSIRQDIINSASIYSQDLTGKVILYVYGDEYFEIFFPENYFLHLTGVETGLSAKDFYKNAKKGKLINKIYLSMFIVGKWVMIMEKLFWGTILYHSCVIMYR